MLREVRCRPYVRAPRDQYATTSVQCRQIVIIKRAPKHFRICATVNYIHFSFLETYQGDTTVRTKSRRDRARLTHAHSKLSIFQHPFDTTWCDLDVLLLRLLFLRQDRDSIRRALEELPNDIAVTRGKRCFIRSEVVIQRSRTWRSGLGSDAPLAHEDVLGLSCGVRHLGMAR